MNERSLLKVVKDNGKLEFRGFILFKRQLRIHTSTNLRLELRRSQQKLTGVLIFLSLNFHEAKKLGTKRSHF